MLRRQFIQTTAVAGAMAAAAVKAEEEVKQEYVAPEIGFNPVEEKDGWVWYDAATMPIEGRAWEGEERYTPFDRFPKRWMDKVPPAVRNLSCSSAGMALRFVTNSPMNISFELRNNNLAMYHMPATGASGVDIYGRDSSGKWRFAQMIGGKKSNNIVVQPIRSEAVPDGKREFMIYFPTYNGIHKFRIGVRKGAIFEAAPARKLKPILFYGTSILQGGCSSRTANCAVAMTGRRLDMHVLNFGFSGNGKMEPVMMEAFAELDPSVYVLDCNWNMTPDMIRERLVPGVLKLREAHPDTPILIVEGYPSPFRYCWSDFADEKNPRGVANREGYEKLVADGVKGLYYLDGKSQMPEDGDGTVDNCHANDYGFFVQANAYEKALREILGDQLA